MLRAAWKTCPRAKECEKRGGRKVDRPYGGMQMAPETAATLPMSIDIRSQRSVVQHGLLVSVRRAMTARYNRMFLERLGDRPGSMRT